MLVVAGLSGCGLGAALLPPPSDECVPGAPCDDRVDAGQGPRSDDDAGPPPEGDAGDLLDAGSGRVDAGELVVTDSGVTVETDGGYFLVVEAGPPDGSTDAGPEEPPSDGGPLDAGAMDGGADAGVSCSASVLVTNEAVVATDHPIAIDVPALAGMAPEAANVRVWQDETPLSHWVESADASGARVWARLPTLPAGTTTLKIETCDATASASDLVATFPWVADPLEQSWNAVCLDVDQGSELCVVAADPEQPGFMRLVARSSCFATTYDGAGVRTTEAIDVPAGSYRLDYRADYIGNHFSFCGPAAATWTRWELEVAGQSLELQQCELAGCNNCHPVSGPRRSATFTVGASPVLQMTLDNGDCAESQVTLDRMRLVPVLAPEPEVSVVVD